MRGTRGGGGLQKMLESQVIDFQKAASEIVIYNKKYIYIHLVFTPLLAQSFQNLGISQVISRDRYVTDKPLSATTCVDVDTVTLQSP